jgi:hypothetical protein
MVLTMTLELFAKLISTTSHLPHDALTEHCFTTVKDALQAVCITPPTKMTSREDHMAGHNTDQPIIWVITSTRTSDNRSSIPNAEAIKSNITSDTKPRVDSC